MSNPILEPTKLSPEAVISQLRTMKSQIEEVEPLTQEQRRLIKNRLRTHSKTVVEASINVIGVMDNVSQAIGQPIGDIRQLQDDAIRWKAVAEELIRDGVTSKDPQLVAAVLAEHAAGTARSTIGRRLAIHHQTVGRILVAAAELTG